MELFTSDECWSCDRCGELNWGDRNLRLSIDRGDQGVSLYCSKCMSLQEAHDLFFVEAATGEWDAGPS